MGHSTCMSVLKRHSKGGTQYLYECPKGAQLRWDSNCVECLKEVQIRWDTLTVLSV